jgi:hypothetical protein
LYFFILLAVYGLLVAIFFASDRRATAPKTPQETPLDDQIAGWSLTRHDRNILKQLERELSDITYSR